MGKYKTLINLGLVASLLSLMLLFKNKNMKNYIITAIAALGLGIFLGFILDRDEVVTKVVSDTKVEYRDTCISNNVVANVTTETSTKTFHDIRKGKQIKEESVAPITSVERVDSLITTTFTKTYNYGLCKFTITNIVKATSAATGKFSLDYQLDTLELQKLTTVINTVVVAKDSTDKVPTEIIRYVPVENNTKQTWVSLGGSLNMNPKNQLGYDVGLGITRGKLNVSLFKDPTTDFKVLDGYRVGLNLNTLRLSKK